MIELHAFTLLLMVCAVFVLAAVFGYWRGYDNGYHSAKRFWFTEGKFHATKDQFDAVMRKRTET
jgi:hypothetical protein